MVSPEAYAYVMIADRALLAAAGRDLLGALLLLLALELRGLRGGELLLLALAVDALADLLVLLLELAGLGLERDHLLRLVELLLDRGLRGLGGFALALLRELRLRVLGLAGLLLGLDHVDRLGQLRGLFVRELLGVADLDEDDRANGDERDQEREHADDDPPASALGTRRQCEHGRQKRVFLRRELAGRPGAPEPRLFHRLVAPQEAFDPALRVPLLSGRADLREEARIFLVLVEPAAERGPGLDQRFVDELDGGRVHDNEARRDQQAEDPIGIAAELAQLGCIDARARALRGDQALEDRARELLIVPREARDHLVGVGRERTRDAADRAVALLGEPAMLAIAGLPQLRRGELEQRRRTGRRLERVE